MLRSAALFRQNRYTSQFKKGQLPMPDSAIAKKANMKHAMRMSYIGDEERAVPLLKEVAYWGKVSNTDVPLLG